MRIDKYLKVSRLIKRRTVANKLADAGRILVNGKPAKASYAVKEGDLIEITFGNKPVRVEVLSTEAPSARTLRGKCTACWKNNNTGQNAVRLPEKPGTARRILLQRPAYTATKKAGVKGCRQKHGSRAARGKQPPGCPITSLWKTAGRSPPPASPAS